MIIAFVGWRKVSRFTVLILWTLIYNTGKIIKFPCMYYLWFFGGFAVVFNKIPCVEKVLFFHTWFLHKSTDGF